MPQAFPNEAKPGCPPIELKALGLSVTGSVHRCAFQRAAWAPSIGACGQSFFPQTTNGAFRSETHRWTHAHSPNCGFDRAFGRTMQSHAGTAGPFGSAFLTFKAGSRARKPARVCNCFSRVPDRAAKDRVPVDRRLPRETSLCLLTTFHLYDGHSVVCRPARCAWGETRR